jgi:hypothetical protein
MANFFWVDNGVNYGWSATATGAPADPGPGADADVFFTTASGASYSLGGSSYRNLTIQAGTTTQLLGSVFLTGSFVNSSSVVNIEGLSIDLEATTGTITVTTLNRPISQLRAGPFSGSGTLATYSLGSAITAQFITVQNCNFNTNGHAVTGRFDGLANAPFATTFNFGASTFSSRGVSYEPFTITSSGGDFQFTLNLGTSKINNDACTITLGLRATITASAGQAITNLNSTSVSVSSGNLAITTGTISSSSITLTLDTSASVTVGAISVSSYLGIGTNGAGNKTIGTINGNVQTPATVWISTSASTGAGILNIGAIGGVVANSISTVSMTVDSTTNLTGQVQCVGALSIDSSANTTITGSVVASQI